MSLQSMLKRLTKALPVVLSHLPALIVAVAEVKQAVKTEKVPPPASGEGGAAAAVAVSGPAAG